MTEQEWLECTDPAPMLEFLRGKTTDRKLRLFAVACCRRAWTSMGDANSKKAVETAEDYADGRVTDDDLRSVSEAALSAAQLNLSGPDWQTADWRKRWNALSAYWAAVGASVRNGPDGIGIAIIYVAKDAAKAIGSAEIEIQAGLIRDIFGSPFRSPSIVPGRLQPATVALAQAIYEERTFDRLPVLADALEDSGCDNEEILTHCRQPGVHVRGCWLLDLLLGKE